VRAYLGDTAEESQSARGRGRAQLLKGDVPHQLWGLNGEGV